MLQDPSTIPSLSKFLLSFFCLQIWVVTKDWVLGENIFHSNLVQLNGKVPKALLLGEVVNAEESYQF